MTSLQLRQQSTSYLMFACSYDRVRLSVIRSKLEFKNFYSLVIFFSWKLWYNLLWNCYCPNVGLLLFVTQTNFHSSCDYYSATEPFPPSKLYYCSATETIPLSNWDYSSFQLGQFLFPTGTIPLSNWPVLFVFPIGTIPLSNWDNSSFQLGLFVFPTGTIPRFVKDYSFLLPPMSHGNIFWHLFLSCLLSSPPRHHKSWQMMSRMSEHKMLERKM